MSADRLRALLSKALDALAEALEHGDDKATVALVVLKLAGPLPLVPTEPTDPEDILRYDVERERDRITSVAQPWHPVQQYLTDPKGLVQRNEYDGLGRTTKTIENSVNGTVSDSDDKTTTYAYNAAGMTSLTAQLTGGGGQTTQWVYGVTTGGGSAITSNDVVGVTQWPDPSTGAASGSEQETVTVNALGQPLTVTDRNGSVHTLTYDVLGRVTVDTVTTLGSGVDGSVRRIETAYDGQGNAYLITSYSATSGGSIVHQVQRAFNGLGQLITEWQQRGAAVNTSTSPKVQYAYSGHCWRNVRRVAATP